MDSEQFLNDQEIRDVIEKIPTQDPTPTFPEIVEYIKAENSHFNETATTNYDSNVDDESQGISKAEILSKLLLAYGYTDTDAYITSVNPVTGLTEEIHGRLVGIAPVRRESTYDGGTLIEESGWDFGFGVRKLLFNCLNQPDTYQDDIIAVTNPGFSIELGEEKLQKQLDSILVRLEDARRPDLAYSAHRLGEYLLRAHIGGTTPTRKITQLALSLAARSPVENLTDDIAQLITYGFGRSAYEINAQTEYTAEAGALRPTDTRTRHTIIGNVTRTVFVMGNRSHQLYMGLTQDPNQYDPIHVPRTSYVDMQRATRTTRLN